MKSIFFSFVWLCMFAVQIIHAQVTIGVDAVADPSAVLDIQNPVNVKKGVLFPSISIADSSQWGLAGTTAREGMVVYNINPNISFGKGFYFWDGTQWAWLKAGNAQSQDWNLGGNKNGLIKSLGTADNFDLPIITNGQIRMSVTSAGKVGVGTTTPKAKFSVSGGPISLDDYGDGDKLYFLGNDSAAKIRHSGWNLMSYAGSKAASSSGFFSWHTVDANKAWAERMRIANDGSVYMMNLPATASTSFYPLVVDAATGAIYRKTTPALRSEMAPTNSNYAAADLTGGSSREIPLDNDSEQMTLVISMTNTCGQTAFGNFMAVKNALAFVSGLAVNTSYSVSYSGKTTWTEGNILKLTAHVEDMTCEDGSKADFANFSIQKKGNKLIVTNNGTSTVSYTIALSQN